MPRSTKWHLPFKLIYYISVYTQRPLVWLEWQVRIKPSVSEQQMVLWTFVFIFTTGARKAVIKKENWEYWMAGRFKQVALHVYQKCTNRCRHHYNIVYCLPSNNSTLLVVGRYNGNAEKVVPKESIWVLSAGMCSCTSRSIPNTVIKIR